MKIKTLLLSFLALFTLACIGVCLWMSVPSSEPPESAICNSTAQEADICIITAPEEKSVRDENAWRGFAMRFNLDELLERYPRLNHRDRYKDLSETESADGAMEYDLAKMSSSEWKREFSKQSQSPYPFGYLLFNQPLVNDGRYNRITHGETGRAGVPFGSYRFEGRVLSSVPTRARRCYSFSLQRLYMDVRPDGWELATACHVLETEKIADRIEDVDWAAVQAKADAARAAGELCPSPIAPQLRKGLEHGVYLVRIDGSELLILSVTPHREDMPAPTAESSAARARIFPWPDATFM